MSYEEKRKKGQKRILKKIKSDHDKKERIENNKDNPIAIKNDFIFNSIYSNLTLEEKKLYRFLLSRIKKDDDINTTFIIRHKDIQEIFNQKHFTSKVIFNEFKNISNSFNIENEKKEFYHIPVFKMIKTSTNYETTEIVFNEFFTKILFFDSSQGHFLKYHLSSILKYKKLHTIELFEMLFSYVKSKRKKEIVDLIFDIERLKKLLCCEKQETKDFIKQVIKKSIEEINEYNKLQLGGTVVYKYNKNNKTITFYSENIEAIAENEKIIKN